MEKHSTRFQEKIKVSILRAYSPALYRNFESLHLSNRLRYWNKTKSDVNGIILSTSWAYFDDKIFTSYFLLFLICNYKISFVTLEYNRLLCLKDYSNKDFMRTKKTSQLIIIENQSIYKNCLLSMQKKKNSTKFIYKN